MTLGQLISIYRDDVPKLEIVLSQPDWKKYQSDYLLFKENSPRQELMEQEIPFELALYGCELNKKEFWLYYGGSPQVLSSYKQNTKEPCQRMLCTEAFVRFGANAVEDALEKGSSVVAPRPLMIDEVEVLRVLHFDGHDPVVDLRSAGYSLKTGDIIKTAYGSGQWKIKRPLPASYINDKITQYVFSRNQQGIYGYEFEFIDVNDKPKPASILKLERVK